MQLNSPALYQFRLIEQEKKYIVEETPSPLECKAWREEKTNQYKKNHLLKKSTLDWGNKWDVCICVCVLVLSTFMNVQISVVSLNFEN